MNFWIIFWKIMLIGTIIWYFLLICIVGPRGIKDTRELLKKLKKESDTNNRRKKNETKRY
jgi:hypothetical protein